MLANVEQATIDKMSTVLNVKGYTIDSPHTFKGYDCFSRKTTWIHESWATY
jgi:hypothetical protein